MKRREEYIHIPNIVYKHINNHNLCFDCYLPKKDDQKFPWIVFFHGGSWKNGTRKKMSHFRGLVENGFAVFSVSYRFIDEAGFPSPLEDCRDALSYILRNANEYNLDASRLGLFGSSAGGHLAALTALADGCHELGFDKRFNIKCLSTLYAPSDFYELPKMLSYYETEDWSNHFGTIRKLMGGHAKDIPKIYRLASPVYHVSYGAPPILLIHGLQDAVVPYAHSLRMKEKYEKYAAFAELLSIDNCNHSFLRRNVFKPINPSIAQINEQVVAFFSRHL